MNYYKKYTRTVNIFYTYLEKKRYPNCIYFRLLRRISQNIYHVLFILILIFNNLYVKLMPVSDGGGKKSILFRESSKNSNYITIIQLPFLIWDLVIWLKTLQVEIFFWKKKKVS